MKGTALLLTLAVMSWQAMGSEIDSFTPRESVQLKDSLEIMNQKTNEGLKIAMDKANQKNHGQDSCDSKMLVKQVFKSLGKGILISPIETTANQLGPDYVTQVKRKDSMYKSLKFFESMPLYLYGLGGTISINGYTVGADKFGHFFHEGYFYMQRIQDGKGLDGAFAWGEFTERSYYGLATTGVYSHGDLMANFNGLRFWQALTEEGQQPDQLGLDEQAYFRCENGKWAQIRTFDWTDYIDGGWDEAINACDFIKKREKSILTDIEATIGKMTSAKNTTVPLDPSECTELVQKYGEYAPHVLDDTCIAAAVEDISSK